MVFHPVNLQQKNNNVITKRHSSTKNKYKIQNKKPLFIYTFRSEELSFLVLPLS